MGLLELNVFSVATKFSCVQSAEPRLYTSQLILIYRPNSLNRSCLTNARMPTNSSIKILCTNYVLVSGIQAKISESSDVHDLSSSNQQRKLGEHYSRIENRECGNFRKFDEVS